MLDYIGDVGGLLDGLKFIAATLIAPFSSYNYLILLLTKLFQMQGEEKTAPRNEQSPPQEPAYDACNQAWREIQGRKPFREKMCADFLSYVICCLRKSTRRKQIKSGIQRIEEQLDIVRLIKNQVAIERFFKIKMSPLERYFIKNDRNFVLSAKEYQDKEGEG